MSLPDETLAIETPENVAFGYQVAGLGSRFLATMIDTLLIGVLQFAVILVVLLILRAVDALGGSDEATGWVIAILGIVATIFYWGYYVFFEMLWNGQTPGKRWVNLRVIRGDGTPITLSESLIRNLARLVDFLPAAYGIGIITMFIDKQSRRLGDLAAGTLVVHDRAPIAIQDLLAKGNINWEGITKVSVEDFPIERLTNKELSLIEDFLRRREHLTHRDQLAVQILNTLYERVGLPLPKLIYPPRYDAEDRLASIWLAAQNRDKE